MNLKKIFSNNFETSEDAKEQDLTTHYYSNDYETVKQQIVNYAKTNNFEVENINDDYREILLTFKRGEVIVTLYKVSLYLTSVDFKATTAYIIPFGRSYKVVKKFYEGLNKHLTLKSIGGGHFE